MRATINGIVVEGTPDEISILLKNFSKSESLSSITSTSKPAESLEDFAFRVLKRRPLSNEQASTLSLLAKNYPNWTMANSLQEAANYTPSQFAGSLGAFGKRVYGTDGCPDDFSFFETEWDYDEDSYKYRLTESSLAAVSRAGL